MYQKKELFKVTIHVGTDQNIENEIFAEYKYTLNELLVTKIVFQWCFSPEVKNWKHHSRWTVTLTHNS